MKKPEVDDDGNVVGTINDDRLSRRNQIADQADALREADFGGKPFQDDDDDDDDTVKSEPESVEPEVTEPRKIKLKVNGKELELTEDEVIARAQKVESADEYLRSAAESYRKTQRQEPSPQVDVQPQNDEDDLALARALQMGSEEEAVQALRKLRARPSEVTPDVVARVVDERLTFRQAAEWFNGEYKDILADPILKSLAYQRDSELAQKEPELDYRSRLEKVGNEIRTWKQGIAGKPETPKIDKAARKASVAPVPSAAGRQSSVGEDEGEDDPEQVIAQMAKTRGQGRAVQH